MLSGETRQRGPKRVVIVSDDPLFVDGTTFGFRTGGEFTVFHCPAATRVPAAAIANIGRDAVLIDDAGPAADALELVRELCAQVERPVVIVLSGSSDHDHQEAFLELGATAVIAKTLHNRVLVTFVREALAGRILVRAGRAAATTQSLPVRVGEGSLAYHTRRHELARKPGVAPIRVTEVA